MGSGVVRIDPLCFLAGCRSYKATKPGLALSVVYLSMFYCIVVFRAPVYVLLVFFTMCYVFWLFWLICQYLPSDWLERPLWGSLKPWQGDCLQKAQAEECLWFSWFIVLFQCFIICLCCLLALCDIFSYSYMVRYSLFVLKVVHLID